MVGQRAEENATTIGTAGVICFVGSRFTFIVGDASQHEHLIENVEVTRPERIRGGAARIHGA